MMKNSENHEKMTSNDSNPNDGSNINEKNRSCAKSRSDYEAPCPPEEVSGMS